MLSARLALLVPLSLAVSAGALAQDVEVINPDEVEVVDPEEVRDPEGTLTVEDDEEVLTEESDNVDVVEPEETVEVDPGEVGEAATVSEDDLTELDEDFVLPTLNLPVDALDDYDLVDRNGEYLGEVEAVLGPNENAATSIAVSFDGPGWLFDEDVTRVVDIGLFTIEGDNLIIDITEDDVRALPVYTDD